MTAVPMTRRDVLLLAGATLLTAEGVLAQADWPRGQTIKFVVPFTAGSGTDIVARLVGEKLGPALGTSIVVDNRPGAGGTLGAALVAKAPPDGYTLLVHSAGHLVNPAIYPNLSYDTLKDFAGITPLASLPNVLVTAPDSSRTCATWSSRRRQARQLQLRLGRQRLGDAHECRGVPPRRRHAGAARAVQRHARGDERDHGRPHRLVLRAAWSRRCR